MQWAPDLTAAIERHPLTASPETPFTEVIVLISQAHHCCACSQAPTASTTGGDFLPSWERQAGCVLVMQEQQLLGIVTERDVVRLTATGMDLTGIPVSEVMVSPVITLPQRSLHDIFAALFLLRRYRIRHLPIVDDQGAVLGVISHASLRQVLRPANLLKFRRVADVMTYQVIQAPLTSPVLHLAQLMADCRVSCVVITQLDANANPRPVGIVTERDIVQFQALQIDLVHTPACELMSTPLFLLEPNDSLWTAHQEMQKRHVGRLVVSWNWGQGMGIVTQTSLLRVFDPMEMYGVIDNLQQTIEQLSTEKRPPVPLPSNRATAVVLPEDGACALGAMLSTLDGLIDQPEGTWLEVRSHLQALRQQLHHFSVAFLSQD